MYPEFQNPPASLSTSPTTSARSDLRVDTAAREDGFDHWYRAGRSRRCCEHLRCAWMTVWRGRVGRSRRVVRERRRELTLLLLLLLLLLRWRRRRPRRQGDFETHWRRSSGRSSIARHRRNRRESDAETNSRAIVAIERDASNYKVAVNRKRLINAR